MDILNSIMEEAKTFYNNAKQSKRCVTWSDYEYFKHRLLDNGLYGYESRLAEILHI